MDGGCRRFAGGRDRWRGGAVAGRETSGPASQFCPDQLELVVGMICGGGVGRYREGRFRVLVPALLLLAHVDVFDSADDVARGRRRHPVEVLLEVPPAAFAAAGLVRQIVALLGPEVLVSLPLGPGPGPAAGLEICQDALLPLLEALPVHVPPGDAVLVVARHPDGVPQVVEADERVIVVVRVSAQGVGPETLSGRDAAASEIRLGSDVEAFRIDSEQALNFDVTMTLVVAPRCHTEPTETSVHFRFDRFYYHTTAQKDGQLRDGRGTFTDRSGTFRKILRRQHERVHVKKFMSRKIFIIIFFYSIDRRKTKIAGRGRRRRCQCDDDVFCWQMFPWSPPESVMRL